MPPEETAADRLRAALTVADSSSRLQAALAAGTRPRDEYVEVLLARCAIEPDLPVREMLSWALMRHPPSVVVPLVVAETTAEGAQARAQALHTLSKARDPRGWVAITPAVLHDPDDRVARTAWRAAAILVPADEALALAARLATELGRGDRDRRYSLSRALVTLGDAARPVLEAPSRDAVTDVRIHAVATQRMLDDADEAFEAAMFEAERIVVLGDAG